VLGLQGACQNGDSLKDRIDAMAAILKFRRPCATFQHGMAYAPPFGSAMDVLNAAANAAENILMGRSVPIQPVEFAKLWENRASENLLCIDTREWGNAEPFVNKYPEFWKNIPQGQIRDRLDEIPRDKKIVLLCNTGGRSYESQVILAMPGSWSRSTCRAAWASSSSSASTRARKIKTKADSQSRPFSFTGGHMSRILTAIMLLVPCWVWAAPIQVTLFPDSAQVEETSAVTPEAGEAGLSACTLILPGQADPASLRFGRLAGSGSIADLSWKMLREENHSAIEPLNRRLEELKANRSEALSELEGVRGRMAFWKAQTAV
jgi:hypothetical protein